MKSILQTKQLVILFTLAMFTLFGCSEDGVMTSEQSLTNSNDSAVSIASKGSHGKVIHHVNVGSNDLCETFGLPHGCDGNLSLVVNLYEDGYIRGQWQDTYFGGGEGVHVAIDCVKFGEMGDVKWAIISGIITHGKYLGEDVTGLRPFIFVGDSGVAKQDDYMSFTFVDEADCLAMAPEDFWVFPIRSGQVVIW